MPREEANEQNPYVVAIAKRMTGCTDRLRIKVVGHVLTGGMYSFSSVKWKYRIYYN